eukprot:227085-Pelagomonas_calceolata.AAC.1
MKKSKEACQKSKRRGGRAFRWQSSRRYITEQLSVSAGGVTGPVLGGHNPAKQMWENLLGA